MSTADVQALRELIELRFSGVERRLDRVESKVDESGDEISGLKSSFENLKGRFAVWVTLGGVAAGAIAAYLVQGIK